MEESFGKREKEKRNSQGKEPRTFDENSQGGDLSTVKQTARERTQEPSKNQLKGGVFRRSERRRNVGKKEENDKKKHVKYRRRTWWTKCKERIASFLTVKRTEEEKEKKGRKSD